MFGSAVLDTAIGLVFVFLLVSLACSAAKEFIEIMLKQRPAYLRHGVLRLFGGDTPLAHEWQHKLYVHPLIQALCKHSNKWPSYIPSETFAKAILDLVRTQTGDTLPAPGSANAARELEATIEKIPNEAVREALLAAVGITTRTIEDVQREIETWFNNTMERVSGWYKQWSQVWIFGIGAVITLLLNLDAIAVGRSLWQDPALRATLVQAAQKEVEEGAQREAKKKAAQGQPVGEDPEAGWKRVKETASRVSELGVPVGWDSDDPRSVPRSSGPDARPVRDWLLKALGWLITILAVSLGAPFWFDVLNRFMIVRSTVRPKEKSPEEPPIDAKKTEK
jgi:hypothetical protein